MIKNPVPGQSLKEHLLAKKKDRIYTFLMGQGQIRGALIHATHMIKEMQANHHLGVLESLVLGHAYLGVALMASNHKEGGQIALKIDCQGPIKGLSVDANSRGEVRGYLKVNPIPIDKPPDSFNTSPFYKEGFLEVINFPQFATQPYTGKVNLKYGELGSDLANYYLQSEQIPTVFNLSIKFDKNGNIIGAGGLLLQSLPGADEELINKLEPLVTRIPSIGAAFSENLESEKFIKEQFKNFKPKILTNKRVEFFCPCSKEKVSNLLTTMEKDVLKDIIKKDQFPQESVCHNCNSTYTFSKEEIGSLIYKLNQKDNKK